MLLTWLLKPFKPPPENAEWIHWGRAIFATYFLTSIPYRIAFLPEFEPARKFPGFVVLDLASTTFFCYDTLVLAQLHWNSPREDSIIPTTYEPQKDVDTIIQDRENFDETVLFKQTRHIRHRWRVLFSLATTVPLEYLSYLLEGKDRANYCMINKLFRLFYLKGYLEYLSMILGSKGHLKNVGFRRTWALFFAMALAGHWCGCGFYYVSRKQAEKGVAMTWPEAAGLYSTRFSEEATESNLIIESTLFESYIQSLYWAYITMITTGFGDIVPLTIQETVWCVFSMLVGVFITALTIANLQQLVTSLDASRLSFQREMEIMKKFLRYRLVPAGLQKRITNFFDHQWDVLKGEDEQKFLLELPQSLQQQVTNFMCRDIIASLSILRKANTSLLNALVECTEMNTYSPNDEIVKVGEKIRGAILISRGEAEVMKGAMVERKLRRLDRFAEECLFVDKVSLHSVRSKGFSEVLILPSVLFQVSKMLCIVV